MSHDKKYPGQTLINFHRMKDRKVVRQPYVWANHIKGPQSSLCYAWAPRLRDFRKQPTIDGKKYPLTDSEAHKWRFIRKVNIGSYLQPMAGGTIQNATVIFTYTASGAYLAIKDN